MAGEPEATFTELDVRSLAAKLKGLHALLTPGEQALLQTVLQRAAARDERFDEQSAEVEGYDWAVSFNPFTYLDAVAGEPFRR